MSKIARITIENLVDVRVLPIPTKPVVVVKAVREDKLTVLLDAKGNIYASGIRFGFFYGSKPPGISIERLIVALGKLGVLSPKATQQWADEQALRRAQEDRLFAAERLLDASKDLGLRLTAAQLRAVQAAGVEV